ncbi:MAG: GGDEF domain-containing protein [Bacillota bacterium]
METVSFFTLTYASGTFILLLTTGFIAYLSKSKYLNTWALYWAILTIAYSSLYSFEQTNSLIYSLLYVLAVILASFLFIYGVHNLLQKPFKKVHALVFLSIIIVLTVSNATVTNTIIQSMIQALLISVFFYWGSILLFVKKTPLYKMLGVLGTILAINYTFFPLMYESSWYVPYGYIIAGFIGMIFGLGIIAHYLMHVHQENIAMQKTLTYMSYHDALTSAYNRGYLDQHIAHHDNSKTFPYSMIVLDLNDLKKTNDQYGHRRGDAFLIKLTTILKEVVEKCEAQVIRYGGDEFVVVLPGKPFEQANHLVNTIKTHVGATIINELTLSVAIGAASKKQSEEPLLDVFDRAEAAMYKNKNAM